MSALAEKPRPPLPPPVAQGAAEVPTAVGGEGGGSGGGGGVIGSPIRMPGFQQIGAPIVTNYDGLVAEIAAACGPGGLCVEIVVESEDGKGPKTTCGFAGTRPGKDELVERGSTVVFLTDPPPCPDFEETDEYGGGTDSTGQGGEGRHRRRQHCWDRRRRNRQRQPGHGGRGDQRHGGRGPTRRGRRAVGAAREPGLVTREDSAGEPDEDADPTHQGSRLADISRLGRIFGKVVAPTTLLTGLLFYFGWSFTYWYFHYLGVNSTLLGSTSQDYLMRSVDALFVPVTVAAVVGLLALWARAVIPQKLSSAAWARVERQRVPVSTGLGLVLVESRRRPWSATSPATTSS